jgi:large subunit ribosomal protein L24
MSARIKKGDTVVVIAGKEKGKQGKVLEVGAERVMIEGLAPIKRHLKPGRSQQNPQGGIVEKNGTIHISNVMPVDPKTKKGTRVKVKVLGDGKKVRIAKSGEQLV